jgi:hypothetical protein
VVKGDVVVLPKLTPKITEIMSTTKSTIKIPRGLRERVLL